VAQLQVLQMHQWWSSTIDQRELGLLLACARVNASEADKSAVRRMLEEGIEKLLRISELHRAHEHIEIYAREFDDLRLPLCATISRWHLCQSRLRSVPNFAGIKRRALRRSTCSPTTRAT
jgi:hypothetical protein